MQNTQEKKEGCVSIIMYNEQKIIICLKSRAFVFF